MNSERANSVSALPTLACVALVCALGIGALYQVSMGFRVLTVEDARRLEIARRPLALPPTRLHLPEPVLLHDALAADGRIAIVSFIYTTCTELCSVLGNQFQRLQRQITARGLEQRVRLVSVSFDPRDTPAKLHAYAQRQGARADVWRFAALPDDTDRARLLEAVGIIVLPAPRGEFEHNAALHLVGADARLLRIAPIEEPEQALEHALLLAPDGGAP